MRIFSRRHENFFSLKRDAYSNNLLIVAAFYLLCLLDMNGYTLDDMQCCGK